MPIRSFPTVTPWKMTRLLRRIGWLCWVQQTRKYGSIKSPGETIWHGTDTRRVWRLLPHAAVADIRARAKTKADLKVALQALRIIAGQEQPWDYLMGNVDYARDALDRIEGAAPPSGVQRL